MDSLSKDILHKICTLLDKKEVLILRTISKRFDRIVSIYAGRHYYFNLKYIIPELLDFLLGSFLTKNFSGTHDRYDGTIIPKIKKINNIFLGDHIKLFDKYNIYSLFENVHTIKIRRENDTNYHFLSSLKSLQQMILDIDSNFDTFEPKSHKFPLLETIKILNIQKSANSLRSEHMSLMHILEKVPNIEKLTCTKLNINIQTIPSIKHLKIRLYKSSPYYRNIFFEKSLNDVTFSHLEFLEIDTIYVFVSIPVKIFMPNLNSLCIKRRTKQKLKYVIFYYDEKGPDHNTMKCILEKIIFDPAKIEYLELDQDIVDVFLQMYPKNTFKSLKKYVLNGFQVN